MNYSQVLDAIIQVAQTTVSPEPFEDALALLPLLQEQDKYTEREYARRFRDLASEAVMRCCEKKLYDDADRIMSCIESIRFGAVTN